MTTEDTTTPNSDAFNAVQEDDPHKPLWRFVFKKEKVGSGGGNWSFQCCYCKEVFMGSYSRVKGHLLHISGQGIKGCKKITPDQLTSMKKIHIEAENRMKIKVPKDVPLPCESMSFRQEGFEPRKKRAAGDSSLERELNNGQRGSLKSVLNNGQREILDQIIARMFYTAGLPFNLARNPYYAKAFTYAATHNISGYVPPGYNKLRTTLLDKERVHIENLVEPIKYKWGEKGVTIVSDGWTDVERRPLINFMAVADSAPMFLKAVNCEGVVKDKYKIASLIRETIKEVGPTHVVQVLTDNASVCKAAGKIIEQEYPNIFWTPCVVHTLNLALKNICAAKNTDANEVVYGECSWITEVVSDCTYIRNFILNHSMRNHMFTQHSKLKMLSIADTRFASAIIMLRRFKAIRQGLSNMVMDQAWSDYKEDDVRKAQVVKQKIVSDIWWDKIDYILSFTKPIYEMLRACDTDEPTLHLVYEMWDTMIAKVKVAIYRHEHLDEDDSSSFFNVVSKILNDRWSKSSTPLHCLAYSLNPR